MVFKINTQWVLHHVVKNTIEFSIIIFGVPLLCEDNWSQQETKGNYVVLVAPRRINANRREIVKGNFPICHAFVFEMGSHPNCLAPTNPEQGFPVLGFDRFEDCVRVFVTSCGTLDLHRLCVSGGVQKSCSVGGICFEGFFCVNASCQNGTVVPVGQVKTHIRSDKNPSRSRASMVSLPEIC